MTICKVIGSIVSTEKNVHLNGLKILVVQPVDLNQKPIGSDMLAIDEVQAGKGDLVLVMREGGSARIVFNNKKLPVQAVVVGVIDDFHVAL